MQPAIYAAYYAVMATRLMLDITWDVKQIEMFPNTYTKTLIANIKSNCCAKASFSSVQFMEIKICLLASFEVNLILFVAYFDQQAVCWSKSNF